MSIYIKTHGSESQGQERKCATVCLLHERTFSSFDVIITDNLSTFKPPQNLLANTNQHPKDKSNQFGNSSFPTWSKLMNFVFTGFFFPSTEVGSSPFSIVLFL